jgi:hypothetical protein
MQENNQMQIFYVTLVTCSSGSDEKDWLPAKPTE